MISRTWEQVHVVLKNREMNREDTEDAGNRSMFELASRELRRDGSDVMVATVATTVAIALVTVAAQ